MAGNREQQARQKWRERWVRRTLQTERPDLADSLWARSAEAWDAEKGQGSPPARAAHDVVDLLGALERSLDAAMLQRHRPGRADAIGSEWCRECAYSWPCPTSQHPPAAP